MASSYGDSYEDRLRRERRSKRSSYVGSRDDEFRSSSSTSSYAGTSGLSSGLEPPSHRHDPRIHRSSSQRSSSRRPSSRTPRSPIGKRQNTWPPQPTCEDEKASLAKEAASQQLLKESGKDEALERGSIDQEPILQDVQSVIDSSTTEGGRDSNSRAIPTPPTSEDERARKARRRPSRLTTAADDVVPEMSSRTASPYAFAKPAKQRDSILRDQFQSPSTLTPPLAETIRRHRGPVSSAPSSPRGDKSRYPSGDKAKDYFSPVIDEGDSAIDESTYDTRHGSQEATRRRPTASPIRSETMPSVSAASKRASDVTSFQSQTPKGTRSSSQMMRDERLERQTPPRTSTGPGEISDSQLLSPASTFRSSDSARDSGLAPSLAPSPRNSPRSSMDTLGERPITRSSTSSRPSSLLGSRPASPVTRTPADSPRLARTDLDWSTLVAANAARRGAVQRPSSALRQDASTDSNVATPIVSPTRPGFNRTSSLVPLPYPEDDSHFGIAMPSEWQHQYAAPVTLPPTTLPFQYEPRPLGGLHIDMDPSRITPMPPMPPMPTTSPGPPVPPTSRPPLSTRPSAASVVSAAPRTKVTEALSPPAISTEARRELAALQKRELPQCLRSKGVAGYDDWYTVVGATGLDICPDCVDSIFERTLFRPHIRRSPPQDLRIKVQCAFGSSAWIRQAWLLTLQQRRVDLTLLKLVTEIEDATEPCPGDREAKRSWYGFLDPDGVPIKNFYMCSSDVQKIESLFPSLAGSMVKLAPRTSGEKRTCGVRTGSSRFAAYIGALAAAHDKAVAYQEAADTMPVVKLLERKSRLPECTRDNMLLGELWHFTPAAPALTICADCFDTVVQPEIRRSSELAADFPRKPKPVMHDEGIGSSCQLYSPYMRRVFRRAVRDNDMKYLARKSRERREAEIRLQERFRDVTRRARRISKEGGVNEEDERRRLNREVERITTEWQSKWE